MREKTRAPSPAADRAAHAAHAGARLHAGARAAAGALPPLLLAAERIASTIIAGGHGRRRVGAGESFWQFRRYQPGDALAQIDWRASARSPHCYIREREWAAAQSVTIWADVSGSMAWASRKTLPQKKERAQLLALALASLLLRAGERVQWLGLHASAATSISRLPALAAALLHPGAEAMVLPPAQQIPARSTLVLISDFLAPVDHLCAALAPYVGVATSGVMLQLLDPAELSLPFTGRVEMTGCEGEEPVLFPRIETLRAAYRQRLAAQTDAVSALAHSAGWSFIRQTTALSASAALLPPYLALTGGGRTAGMLQTVRGERAAYE